jgi:hypothetical protein
MLVSLASIAVNYAVASRDGPLCAAWGHAGLALSTFRPSPYSGSWFCSPVLRKRIGGVYGRSLALQIGKVAVASAAMAAVIALFVSRHVGMARSFPNRPVGPTLRALDSSWSGGLLRGLLRALKDCGDWFSDPGLYSARRKAVAEVSMRAVFLMITVTCLLCGTGVSS